MTPRPEHNENLALLGIALGILLCVLSVMAFTTWRDHRQHSWRCCQPASVPVRTTTTQEKP